MKFSIFFFSFFKFDAPLYYHYCLRETTLSRVLKVAHTALLLQRYISQIDFQPLRRHFKIASAKPRFHKIGLFPRKYFCTGVRVGRLEEAKRVSQGLFSTPDGYALTRHNVLSKFHAGVCGARDTVRATDTRLLPVSASCVYLMLLFRLSAHLPTLSPIS